MITSKTLKIALFTIVVVFTFFIIGIFVFPKQIVEYALHRAGYEDVQIEHVSVDLSGAHLTNISYAGHQVAQLDLAPRTRTATFSHAALHLPTPSGDFPLTAEGTVTDEGAVYRFNATFAGETAFATASGTTNGTIDKSTHAVQAHVELNESKASLPDVDIKRATGWADINLPAGGRLPDVNAQFTIGVLKAYGVSLQGTTISSASTPEKTEVVVQGRTPANDGSIELDFKADRADPTLDRVALNAEAKLKRTEGEGRFTLSLSAEKEKSAAWQDIKGWKALTGKGDLGAKNLTLPGLVEKANAAARLKLDFDPASNTLKADIDADKTAYLAAFKSNFRARPREEKAGIIDFSGDLREPNGLFQAAIKGKHDTVSGAGDVSIDMPPVTLVSKVNTLADISPITVKYIEDTSGTIGLDARLGWTKAGLTSSSGALFLRRFSGTVKETPLTDISAVIKLDSLMPPTMKNQTVAIGAVNVGLPITNGVIEASLGKKDFTLHRAEWDLAKGKISSSPFTMPLDDLTADVTLTATGLDLPELFKVAPMEGLDATGAVNGTLPLQIRKGDVTLTGGVLETTGSGEVRYNPQEVPAFLSDTKNKQIADLRVALKAFEYQSLRMTLDGEIGKTQKIGLHIEGKNPEFYSGHPVKLNLNVEGPLQNVLKYNPGGSQIPDNIKKQLEEYEKKNANK